MFIIGSNVAFSMSARRTSLFTYTWRKQGVPIGGALSSSYSIAGVTTNDAAGHDPAVSNPYGSITSSPRIRG